MKRSRILTLGICLILISSSAQHISAEEITPLYTLADCKNTPDKACIESFSAVDDAGKTHEFRLTGRAFIGDDTGGPNGTYKNAREDEYEAPTLILKSGKTAKVIVRAFVFPLGNNPCEWAGSICIGNNEFIQIVLEPSYLDPRPSSDILTLPKRKNQYICGTKQKPELCMAPMSFGQNLMFKLNLRIPKDFDFSFVNGRSSTFVIENSPDTQEASKHGLRRVSLQMGTVVSPGMIFSELSTNPYSETDFADYIADRPLLNLFTNRSATAKSLGSCASIPSISIITNGNNASIPAWNTVSQSIDVSVEGPHFSTDGSLNRGFFQARISKEIGKCLWGVDLSSKTIATISISDQDSGATRIETAASQYRDNYFFFTLANFHYSKPTISLKLVSPETKIGSVELPETSTVAVPVQTQSAKKPLSKATIRCAKGAKVVTRTGVKPICPAGYKKVK
jgi:hypothetical protein